MSPLDTAFMCAVAFAVFKIVQFWVVWELKGDRDI